MSRKNLFLIDGAAGTGKSDLLEFVDRHLPRGSTTIRKKYTTRKLRAYEKRSSKSLDLLFLDHTEFHRQLGGDDAYTYTYPRHDGAWYGVRRHDIEDDLARYDNVFIIIRSARVIQQIVKDFAYVNVVPIFVYTLETEIPDRLRAEGCTSTEIKFRLSRSSEAMEDLYSFPTLYRAVIINNSDKTTYQAQLLQHFKVYTTDDPAYLSITARDEFLLPIALRPHKEAMLDRLRRFPYNRNVFVMMEFGPEHDALFELIRVVAQTEDFNCVRADMNEWAITGDDVYNPYAVLFCCRYGIALFNKNGYNTNVAIELALMQAQLKPCLMLKHDTLAQPPFDLVHRIYESFSQAEDLVPIVRQWLARFATRTV